MSSPRRLGLPSTVRMRHDTHFVDQLVRPSGDSIGQLIPIENVTPNPDQPRQTLGDLSELVSSIREKGVLEPLLVRKVGGRYQIIAGERRWRAAQIARVKSIPVVINRCSEEEMEILALEENLHREDLNDVDRGIALRSLKAHLNFTWEQFGKRVGLSRRRVLMLAGLADLPEEIQTQIIFPLHT